MPITGRPARAASRTAGPRPVCRSVREPWPKLPTPGTSTRSARRTASGSVGEGGLVAAGRERAHHALEVVDPVIHHRDHSAPLVEGTPVTRGSGAIAAVERPGERLERGLDDVMRVVPPHQVEVRGEPGIEYQRAEEFRREEDVVVAQHLPLGDVDVVVQERPAAHVHHRADQRLVQRHEGVAVAADPGTVAQRLGDREAEGDPDVLHRMVPVHVEIALRLDREIEQRVPRQRLEHVVEEPDAGAHRGLAPAVEGDPHEDLGLLGRAPQLTHSAHAVASQDRLQRGQHRVHVFRRADRDPEALGQLGAARDVAHQDAVLLQQPPEELPRRERPAADQHEVGRRSGTP